MAKTKQTKKKPVLEFQTRVPVFEVGELAKYSDYDGRYQTTVSIVKILNINPVNNVCLVEKLEDGFWHLVSMSNLDKLPAGVTV